MKLPDKVTIGPFTVELVCVPHDIMYEVSEAQGTFVQIPPYKIYLDKEMKDEEGVVNSYGNFLTEVLFYSSVKDWIRYQTKNHRR